MPDLRAGLTKLIGATLAHGVSTIEGVEHIEREYEDLKTSLEALGAQIEEV